MQAIFLDTETTGLDQKKHRLLDIAFKIVDLPSGYEKLTYQAIIRQPLEVWEERDLASIEVNGFTWEKALLGKEEKIVKQEIIQIFSDLQIQRGTSVFICQNPSFDRVFFSQLIEVAIQEKNRWPYHWLDFASMFFALQIKECQQQRVHFPEKIPLSKNQIAEHFGLPAESHPHSALNGVNHLLLCYRSVVGFEAL